MKTLWIKWCARLADRRMKREMGWYSPWSNT